MRTLIISAIRVIRGYIFVTPSLCVLCASVSLWLFLI